MINNPTRQVRIALGIAGFVILAGSTPCILWFVRDGYASPDDIVGLFGLGGMILVALFVGITALYQAFKTPHPSEPSEPANTSHE